MELRRILKIRELNLGAQQVFAAYLGILLVATLMWPSVGAAAEKRYLHFGIDAADLGTGDPHKAAARNDRAVVDMIFNGLLRYKPGQAPAVEPDLALAVPYPELAGGKQIWRFELRQDVYCHPSPQTEAYPLTSDDVVFSLMRAADPQRSAYAGDYEGMTVEKVDDFTFEVIFEKPLSSILFFPKVADYAGGLILCRKAYEALGDHGFAVHPVGTGPFQFESRIAGKEVRLAANQRYFRGRPKVEGIVVHYLPDFEERNAIFQEGKLDVMFGSEESDWFESLDGNEKIKVDVFGVGQVITIHFNQSRAPLDDRRVRQAIAYGVDREVFRALFAQGVVENVYSPVPAAFLPGGLTQDEAERLGLDFAYDPDKARDFLSKAGYGNGFTLKLVTSERDHYRVNYESLRDQLAAIGIAIKLEVVKHREMHRRIREDENAIVIYVAWRPNADIFLTRFFHSHSIVVSGRSPDTNFSHYTGIDRLIESARNARDPADQVRIWKQAQIKLLNDLAALPLNYVNLVYARQRNVDYGHPLEAAMALYPQFTEKTQIAD